MINRKFLYFKTLAGFKAALVDKGTSDTGVRSDSIVFIEDQHIIWNRGIFYGGIQDSKSKGLFTSETKLKYMSSSPTVGEWAIVKQGDKFYVYTCEKEGKWINSGIEYNLAQNNNQYTQSTAEGLLAELNGKSLTQFVNDLIDSQRNIPDDSITSAKIQNGTILTEDLNDDVNERMLRDLTDEDIDNWFINM